MDKLKDPTVRALLEAVNSGDRAGFLALLTPGAVLSDDGTERNLEEWIDKEVFDSNGRIEVRREEADGRRLLARFRNDTWGEMSTRWAFEVEGDRISRIETGQA
ncbi:nuclear transport factor 2-like protein [Nocardiopsis codii]|uniref:nuclear transport factor 2 family protein n=1 Tax=Nocardiopsis codii TaxID=3065942 RepID=UPI0038B30C1B